MKLGLASNERQCWMSLTQ